MQIDRVEVVPYSLPFRSEYVTARGRLAERHMALLRVRSGNGPEGLGEAVPLSLRGGEDLESVVGSLREAGARLIGLELAELAEEPLSRIAAVMVELGLGRRLPAPAAAAIETSLLDIAGRLRTEPVWQLLGASAARPVRCNATLLAGEPGEVARDAARWAARGFGSFKLKLGTGEDVAVARAVREALGERARLRIDANGVWSVREARRILEDLEPLGIELAEQPVAGLGGMRRLARSTSIPIAADESVASVGEAARARRKRACTYATAKLAKVGGIATTMAIAAEIPIYLSSALDGPVGIAAAAHAAQALYGGERVDPGLAHGLATQALLAEDVASRGCELRADELYLPPGPGLGVQLDEDALARRSD